MQHCILLRFFSYFLTAPPRFRTLPSPKIIGYLGLETRLTCDIVGYPQPTITWHRTNKVSMSVSRFIKKKKHLIIRKTSKEDHGSYMCRASANPGKVFDFIILEVKPVGKRKQSLILELLQSIKLSLVINKYFCCYDYLCNHLHKRFLPFAIL